MALLFDNDDPEASQGFKSFQAAEDDTTGGKIRHGLEELWKRFEPYADKEFIKEFGRHVEERFWEMYLGNRLVEGRKALRKRALRGKKWVKAGASCQFNPRKSRIFEVFTGLETCHVLRHEKAA